MKDFYDVWVLSKTLSFHGETLSRAIRETFDRRETPLPTGCPTAFTERFFADASHVRQWAAFAKPIQGDELSADLAAVVQAIAAFLLPVIAAAEERADFQANWRPGGPWRGSA
jgi:Nucleotidyl transferase AbiEii toxin, Type IV TA system